MSTETLKKVAAIIATEESTPVTRAYAKLQYWALKQGEDIFPVDMIEKAKSVAGWNKKSAVCGLGSMCELMNMVFTVYENIGFTVYDDERDSWKKWQSGSDNGSFRKLSSDYL